MDSSNPYSEVPGFMELLSSQQSTVYGESEATVYGTQWSDVPTEGECTTKDRKTRRKWSPTEDVVLISAWQNTSKDAVVSNEQKASAFWKRICAYFASSPKVAGLEKREASYCKQRWAKINDMVCKFVGCYAAASSQKASGQNENDVMKLANDVFFNDHKSKFTMEHAWRELRHDQKWCSNGGTSMSKKRRTEDGSTHCASSQPLDEPMPRPPSVKASKGKGKRTTAAAIEAYGKSLVEFQSKTHHSSSSQTQYF